MRRICFTLQVRPDRLAEYRRRHAAVWPDMLAALRDAGWRDYSLFLRDDGLLVGYFLTEDLDAALAGMEATGVNARWQAEMAPFFADTAGAACRAEERACEPRRPARAGPVRGFVVLDEVFNLDDQLGGSP